MPFDTGMRVLIGRVEWAFKATSIRGDDLSDITSIALSMHLDSEQHTAGMVWIENYHKDISYKGRYQRW